MDRNRTNHLALLHRAFHELVSRLQKRSFKAKPDLETIRTARGLILLFFAIGLGWVSVAVGERQSIAAYRIAHWPKQSVWEQTLSAHGLKRREDLSHYGKLLEAHPSPFDEEKSIWSASNLCIVYLTQSPYQPGAELWTCDESVKASDWQKLGPGVEGFENLVSELEKIPKKTVLAFKRVTKSVDPKEIHY